MTPVEYSGDRRSFFKRLSALTAAWPLAGYLRSEQAKYQFAPVVSGSDYGSAGVVTRGACCGLAHGGA